MTETIAPGQQRLLSQHFPDHKKTITITCDEDDNMTIQYVGAWDGRIYRAAARKFEGSYKKAMRNMQKLDRPEGFVSYPNREDIQKERAQRAEAHKQSLIDKGRLHPDGSIQSDAQLAETLEKTSLPLPIGQDPSKVKTLGPVASEPKAIPQEPDGPEPTTRVLVNNEVELETDLPNKALPNQDQEKIEKPKAKAKTAKVTKKTTKIKGIK